MGMKFDEIKEMEEKYQLGTYRKLSLAVARGEGVYVWDTEGKRYLDLYGGHAVALVGHCHPRVVKAVSDQVKTLVFYSNVVYSEVRALASKAIVEVAPSSMDRVFFCNSGAEANETALKIARRFTGKTRVVAMKEGFHGRTIGALSATALGHYRSDFIPVLDAFDFIPFGDAGALESAVSDQTAAVMLEPVQSMAGVEIADDGYYKKLRRISSAHGALLIFDEIQTGFGRTGEWFFGDRIGVVPDLITLAKGIGGGLPLGAVLIDKRVSKTIGYGEHGSTFGGGPVAASALFATIQAIREDKLLENARDTGEYLKTELQKIGIVKAVKGRGLLLGIEITKKASDCRDRLLERGIITGTSAKPDVLRLLPPLVLTPDEAKPFIEALTEYGEG
ncbi:MAG: aminotransferase class III-fold pyridoxal phosphate-dependent enzyme [Spirochaetes bacterium]|nr:aminotransferase class III-fold pyridoxal phosphate-dependent enzyme [Spirochaetota bacterium]